MANNFTLGTAVLQLSTSGNLSQQINQQASGAQSTLKGLAKGIKSTLRPSHTIVSAASGQQGLGGLGALFGPTGAVIGTIADAFIGMAQKISSTVFQLAGAANPYAVEKFNDAMKDLYAVVGDAFLPYIDLATDAVRLLADALVDLAPVAKQFVVGFIAPLRAILGSLGFELTGASVGRGQFSAPSFGDIATAKNQYALKALTAGAGTSSKSYAEKTAEATALTARVAGEILQFIKEYGVNPAKGAIDAARGFFGK